MKPDVLKPDVLKTDVLLQILEVGGNSPASADDFLPSLIYVVLKANPPRQGAGASISHTVKKLIEKFCSLPIDKEVLPETTLVTPIMNR